MPDNEETKDDGLTEEQLDAELKAEYEKLTAEPDAPEEGAQEAEPEEAAKPEEAKAEVTDEDADRTAREWLERRGHKVMLAGEEEAVKAGAEDAGRGKTVEDVLKGLPDVALDPEVVKAIDERYGHDPAMRDAMFTRYATQAAVEQIAEQKSREAVAPLAQMQEQAAWQAKAQATARGIAEKAEVPEAQEAVASLILELGPESEAKYKADATYRRLVDAAIKQTVFEVAQSLGDSEQKPLPTAERVGGATAVAAATTDGLTGEAKAMAAEYKKDLASGLITKAEYDQFLKDLQKEAANK